MADLSLEEGWSGAWEDIASELGKCLKACGEWLAKLETAKEDADESIGS